MKKATLIIANRDPALRESKKGYLYTDEKKRKLFVYQDSPNYWYVEEATTGVGIGFISAKTRKKVMIKAGERIKEGLKLSSLTWKEILAPQPILNKI